MLVSSLVSPLALAVSRSRWFRLPLSLVRVRCCFGSFLCGCGFVSGKLVRVWCWFFAFGVVFVPSRLVLDLVVFACAVVSFRLFRGSKHRVGKPSRNLAKKCEYTSLD